MTAIQSLTRVHPDLAEIFAAFRSAQDRAVATLTKDFGYPRPDSVSAWAFYCKDQGFHYDRVTKNGIVCYFHGYGVEVTFPDLVIDFDWGDAGEPDGFDGWPC